MVMENRTKFEKHMKWESHLFLISPQVVSHLCKEQVSQYFREGRVWMSSIASGSVETGHSSAGRLWFGIQQWRCLAFLRHRLVINRITQRIDYYCKSEMEMSSSNPVIGSYSSLRTESAVTRENLWSINNEQVKWKDGCFLGREGKVT